MKKLAFLLILWCSTILADDNLLICIPINGLCNRLKALAGSFIIANATDRQFVVYWDLDPREIEIMGSCAWQELFDYPQFEFLSEFPQECCVIQPCTELLKLHNRSLVNVSNFPLLPTFPVDPEIPYILVYSTAPGAEMYTDIPTRTSSIIIRTIHNIRLSNMSNEEFYKQKRLFYQSLVPTREIREAIQKTEKKISEKTIGVHIRTTDLLRTCWDTNTPAYQKYTQAMDQELLADPETTFFISADNNQALKYLRAKYHNKILFYTGHTYQKNGDIERLSKQGQKNAVADLFLLAKTRKLIGTKFSSFSYEAACIGEIPMVEISHDH